MTYDAGRIRHDGSLMHYSRASNGSSVPSNWRLSATGDTGVVWSPESASAVSYGSNANAVGTANAGGASSDASRADHVHLGVRGISSNGSNTLVGDVNLAAGSGIALGVSGQSISIVNTGSGGGGASVSYASNSNEVSYDNAAGASSLVSRAEHVHRGVTSVSHASNTYTGPVTLETEGSLYIVRPSANTYRLGTTPTTVSGGGGSAGALVLLEQHTASSSAQLDFTTCISSSYDDYVIRFVGIVPATNGTSLYLEMGTGGGPSWDTTAAHYLHSAWRWINGGQAITGSGSDSKIVIDGGEGIDGLSSTATNGGLNGDINLANPGSGSIYPVVYGLTNFYNSAGNYDMAQVQARYLQTTAITGLRFIMASGNIASGTIRVYGVEK